MEKVIAMQNGVKTFGFRQIGYPYFTMLPPCVDRSVIIRSFAIDKPGSLPGFSPLLSSPGTGVERSTFTFWQHAITR
jgi:hypothetical protein